MILLADQPFVTPDDLQAVVSAWQTRDHAIGAVRPRYGDHPGHPVILSRDLAATLAEALDGDRGMGPWLLGRTDVLTVALCPVGRPCPGWDIDTEEDYRRALAARSAGSGGIMSVGSRTETGMERPEREN